MPNTISFNGRYQLSNILSDKVKELFNKQNHSGTSEAIVKNILFTFSSKGPEFCEVTTNEELSPESKQLLEAKKQENKELAQINSKQKNGPRL